jgi:hypothetical protein
MAADHATEIADSMGRMCQTPGSEPSIAAAMTLPGPSRRIIVQPFEAPASPVEHDPPEREAEPVREPAPEPVREPAPERDPVPVP